MSRDDNITPFRRPKPRPVAPQRGGGMGFKTHRGKVVLVHVLTLIAFIAAIIGTPAINLLFADPSATIIGQARLVGWIVGLVSAIAAVVVAYSNRGAAMPWANTHHEHAMRTLMIGYAIWVVASLLIYVHGVLAIATMFIQIGVFIWAAVRASVALVLGIARKPVPNPRGWLF
jgi:uncharacterized membrane protein